MPATPQPLTPGERTDKSILCAVLDDGRTAIVRVIGRGNFLNSVSLKRFADHLAARGKPETFILDLAQCETMDSTFMGILASVSLAQERGKRSRVVVANPNEHVVKLLKTLGLMRLLDVHEPERRKDRELLGRAEESLAPAEAAAITHAEQIDHTLKAHKALVPLDDENESRFQSVIHYLEKSLEEDSRDNMPTM